jgi:hypothetical protein
MSSLHAVQVVRVSQNPSEGATIMEAGLRLDFPFLPKTGFVTITFVDSKNKPHDVVFELTRDNTTLYTPRKTWPKALPLPLVGSPVVLFVIRVR